MRLTPILVGLLAVALLQGSAGAAIVVYSSSDAGADSSALRPNSDAAATSFDVAAGGLGTLSTITFESSPVGAFTSLAAASGVTITGADLHGAQQTIRDVPDGFPESNSIYGYNTTAGGSHFLYALGGTVTFSFSTGVQAFGAYISGIQFSNETITFSDGTSQTVTIPGLGANDGGIAFVGFTDAGASITSITIHAIGSGWQDFVAIDDVRFVTPASNEVPEPATLAIWAALAAMGCVIGKLRRDA